MFVPATVPVNTKSNAHSALEDGPVHRVRGEHVRIGLDADAGCRWHGTFEGAEWTISGVARPRVEPPGRKDIGRKFDVRQGGEGHCLGGADARIGMLPHPAGDAPAWQTRLTSRAL